MGAVIGLWTQPFKRWCRICTCPYVVALARLCVQASGSRFCGAASKPANTLTAGEVGSATAWQLWDPSHEWFQVRR